MRKHVVILLALVLAAPCVARAASDSALAYAVFQVEDTLEVSLWWLATQTNLQDFGIVPSGTVLSDTLTVHVEHNMAPTTDVQVSAAVYKNGGPSCPDRVDLSDGVETFTWLEPDWGVTNSFSTTHQGGSPLEVYLDCVFWTDAQLCPAGTYGYEITITVTSL